MVRLVQGVISRPNPERRREIAQKAARACWGPDGLRDQSESLASHVPLHQIRHSQIERLQAWLCQPL